MYAPVHVYMCTHKIIYNLLKACDNVVCSKSLRVWSNMLALKEGKKPFKNDGQDLEKLAKGGINATFLHQHSSQLLWDAPQGVRAMTQ